MAKKSFEEQVALVTGKQDRLLKEEKLARQRSVKARTAFDNAQRLLRKVEGEASMRIHGELFKSPDLINVPGLGTGTEQWFFTVLRDRLNHDPEMIAANNAYVAAQNEVVVSEADLLDIMDELGVANSQAGLLRAQMTYGAGAA